MFRTVPLSIIRNFSLYTQQWYMSYRFADSKPVWHIPLLCVQWKISDDGQRNCPKHVGFYSKNKFEELVHLVGFIIRIWQTSIREYVVTRQEAVSTDLLIVAFRCNNGSTECYGKKICVSYSTEKLEVYNKMYLQDIGWCGCGLDCCGWVQE